jgi:hypothetical protein
MASAVTCDPSLLILKISKIRGFLAEREIAVAGRVGIVEIAICDARAFSVGSGFPVKITGPMKHGATYLFLRKTRIIARMGSLVTFTAPAGKLLLLREPVVLRGAVDFRP